MLEKKISRRNMLRTTGLAFGQRRKMIRQSLKSINGILEHLTALGIEPTLRAEDLTPTQYLDIAKRLI